MLNDHVAAVYGKKHYIGKAIKADDKGFSEERKKLYVCINWEIKHNPSLVGTASPSKDSVGE